MTQMRLWGCEYYNELQGSMLSMYKGGSVWRKLSNMLRRNFSQHIQP